MNEVEKKGIGKAGTGILILVIVAVMLTVSNLMVYMSLSRQMSTLETDKKNLNIQVSALKEDKNTLKDDISDLQSEVISLKVENGDLQGLYETQKYFLYLSTLTTLIFVTTTVYLRIGKPKVKQAE